MAYRLTMTEEAIGFWHALWAPFQDHELSQVPRGGKTLTYVDKRALENRLDTVCGPHGWWNEFLATDRGMICELSILVPVDVRDPAFHGPSSSMSRLLTRSPTPWPRIVKRSLSNSLGMESPRSCSSGQ